MGATDDQDGRRKMDGPDDRGGRHTMSGMDGPDDRGGRRKMGEPDD
jgi:hypothetical protein